MAKPIAALSNIIHTNPVRKTTRDQTPKPSKMSDFVGAGLYCIISYLDPKFFVDLAKGSKEDGATIQI
jgi:hypothetical protein